MIKKAVMEVLPDVWPMLIIILVIICSLRITYLITKHKKFLLHRINIFNINNLSIMSIPCRNISRCKLWSIKLCTIQRNI